MINHLRPSWDDPPSTVVEFLVHSKSWCFFVQYLVGSIVNCFVNHLIALSFLAIFLEIHRRRRRRIFALIFFGLYISDTTPLSKPPNFVSEVCYSQSRRENYWDVRDNPYIGRLLTSYELPAAHPSRCLIHFKKHRRLTHECQNY